jgi:hypothetical protein
MSIFLKGGIAPLLAPNYKKIFNKKDADLSILYRIKVDL